MTPWSKKPQGPKVRGSGDATASSGGFANTGIIIGDVHQGPVTTPSPYLYQVRKISPIHLDAREPELAQMAEFCTRAVTADAPEHERWLWWQGPAWSGKTALMSSFVLNPPAGVRVVSFFITARFEGQSDRAAFVSEVLHQLSDLTGEPFPTPLTTGNREAYLLRYLDLAAEHCRTQGERLVLVLDGLDEDRGVTVGPDAHSIASVLPTRLPDETCVVVAGRPNPPVPSDVDPDHPLRNPAVVRQLRPSMFAEVIRNEAVRELRYLLTGSKVEQDMLGLVAAAGGGLSIADLADLTGLSFRALEERLVVVTGRTFSVRMHSFVHRAEPDVLILAHEELQNEVVEHLGEQGLFGYRTRLHAWADTWREHSWPPDTPGYLLRGYFGLLQSTNDTERMVALVLDRQRADRLVQLNGGSQEARAEIAATQKAVASVNPADLVTLLRLAMARDRHNQRHLHSPRELSVVWGLLGKHSRALAIARSVPSPLEPEETLIYLARALAESGDRDGARRAVLAAEEMVPALDTPWERGVALVKIMRILRDIHPTENLDRMVGAVPEPRERAEALALAASKWSRPRTFGYKRRMDRAVDTTHRIPEVRFRVEGLAVVAEIAVRCGDLERARELTDKATELSREVSDISNRSLSLLRLVEVRIALGELDAAEALIQDMEIPHLTGSAQVQLVRALIDTGEIARAEALSLEITDTPAKAESRNALAVTAAAAGDLQQALLLVDEAQGLAEGSTDNVYIMDDVVLTLVRIGCPDRAVELVRGSREMLPTGLTHVLGPLVEAGRLNRAEELISEMGSADSQPQLLARIALSAVENGNRAQATEWAERAQESILSAADAEEEDSRAALIRRVARAAARSGEFDYARELVSRTEENGASSPDDPDTLAALAEILAATGDRSRARVMFLRAMEAAGSVTHSWFRPLQDIAVGLWDIGERELAGQALRQSAPPPTQVLDPDELISYWENAIEVRLHMGDNTGALELLETSERLSEQLTDPGTRVWRLATVAEQLARAGELERAEALANTLDDTDNQERVFTTLATKVAERGDLSHARELALSIRSHDRQVCALAEIALVLARSGDPGGCHEISNQVESLAGGFENSHLRESALGTVATALASAGDDERSESLMAAMTIVDRRDEAALALMEFVPVERRHRLVAQVLCGDSWQETFDAIGSVDPGILVAIRDELLNVSGNKGESSQGPR